MRGAAHALGEPVGGDGPQRMVGITTKPRIIG
jgi:hypothetical protein